MDFSNSKQTPAFAGKIKKTLFKLCLKKITTRLWNVSSNTNKNL